MSLINCPECNKEISSEAKSCPQCGYELKSIKNKPKWYDRKGIVVLLLIFFFPIGVYGLIKNNTYKKLTKIILFFLLGIALLATFIPSDTTRNDITVKDIKTEDIVKEANSEDPLNIGKEAISELINKKVPYEKWGEWGSPETLEGTDNKYWVVYLPTANISFVSIKDSDTIIFIDFNKQSAINYLNKIKEERTEKIESHFSVWDGSHRELTTLIKQSMNDPKSYEHVETVYWDMTDSLIVQTKFRGKNGFGGIVLSRVKAKISLDGEVLEIIEQE